MIDDRLITQELLDLIRELNSEKVLPKMSLRPESKYYPLVCCTNNIIGLLFANNFQAIPVFVYRFQYTLGGLTLDDRASLYVERAKHLFSKIKLATYPFNRETGLWDDIKIV